MDVVNRPKWRRTQLGFTLIELLVAMAIVVIMITMSQGGFFKMQRQRRATAARNNFIALVREARSVSLQLGAAWGSPRVGSPAPNAGGCPPEFSDPLSGGFRAGLQINMADIASGWRVGLPTNTEGHSVTYVSDILRIVPGPVGGVPQLPSYSLRCTTINFPVAYRNAVIFNRNLAEGLSGNRLTLTFDSRGSLNSAGPPGSSALQDGVVEVPMREHVEGTGLAESFRDETVLVFASGFACIAQQPSILRCRE